MLRPCLRLLSLFVLSLFAVSSATAEEITLDQAETAVGNWIARGGGFGKLSGGTEVSGRTLEDPETGARMHVVNVPGKGFVVTSADDEIEPVVMFSDDGGGEFVAEEGNPVWDLLRWDLAARTADLDEFDGKRATVATKSSVKTDSNPFAGGSPKEKWAALLSAKNSERRSKATANGLLIISEIRRQRFLKTVWTQRNNSKREQAYNLFSPRKPVQSAETSSDPVMRMSKTESDSNENDGEGEQAPCGCVATAGAQLMRYLEHPKTAVSPKNVTCRVWGVSTNLSMKGGIYDWSGMGKDEPHGRSQCEAVSKVTYDIGVACGGSFSNSTSISTITLVSRLKDTFGYSNADWYSFSSFDSGVLEQAVSTSLDAGSPLLLSIRNNSKAKSGHTVVIDGCGYENGSFAIHINFGWGGISPIKGYNVWYVPPAIHPMNTTDDSFIYNFISGIGYNVFPTQSGSVLSGIVRGPNNRPISKASVTVSSADTGNVLIDKTANDSGCYAYLCSPGTYYVKATTVGAESQQHSVVLKTCTASVMGNALQDIVIPSAKTVARVSASTTAAQLFSASNERAVNSAMTFSAPLSFSLLCATLDAEIHYTLDGTPPSPESPLYDGPITIQDTTTLRAVAYADGMECSETFEQTWTYVDPVSRDNFANARPLTGASGSSTFSNVGYTREVGEPLHSSAGASGGASAWASWMAPSTGDWTFRLESAGDNAQGTTPNPQLAVYIGSSVDALTLVAANDDICSDRWSDAYDDSSMVAFSASAGETYRIAMDTRYGSYGDSYVGDLRLSWAEGFTHWARLDYCSLFAPGPGTTASVGVESSADWCVVECSDWIVPDSATGTNGQSLAFSVLPNETGSDRYGSISIQSGNSDIATVSVRQHVMDFVTTREEAVEAAWRENKRILLVRGREVCSNTSGTLFSSIPSSAVRPLVEAGYVLWYSNRDRQRDSSAYSGGAALPTVAILDPQDMDAPAPATSGYQSPGELRAFLEANASWGGLASPAEVTLSGVGTVMSATPFTMSATFVDGTVLDLKHGTTWAIASGSAATISKTGVLTPVPGRTGTVTVSGSVLLRGQTYTRTMAVRIVDPATVTGLSLVGPDTIDLYDADSGRFSATATFRDGTTAVVAPNWTVEETAVTNAAISADGLVTFPNPEKYTKASRLRVTAECNGVSASKEADVWGWSVTLSSWTTPQRVVWPGQTATIVPQTVTWWRHGVTENPTTDLSGVVFRSEYGWINGTYFSFSGAPSNTGSIELTIPSGKSNTEGYVELCLVAEATRLGRTSSKYCYPTFKYLTSAPAQTVSVTFVADGGIPATQTSKYAVGHTYGYLPEAARKGYSCSWYTAAEGGIRMTTASNCVASVTRLYARWSPNRYYVYYNANGGTGSMYGHYFYYDQPDSLRANAFTKAGAVFAGWATEPDGEVVFEDKAAILNLYDSYHSLALYAKWVEDGYRIVFDANGGVGTMPSQVCRIGACTSLAPASFTRRGATFAGWSRTPDGAAEFSDRAEVCDLATTVGSAVTLYAVWELPAVASIEVSGPDVIDLYDVDSARFSATCRLADGSVVDVAPRWSVEETAVTNALVSTDGLVSFPAPEKYTMPSRLTVTAECNGVRASRTADVWGWSATIAVWTSPQRTLWPGQTMEVVPVSVRWWRHGVTEDPTTDFSGVEFSYGYGWVNNATYVRSVYFSDGDRLALPLPSDLSEPDGRASMCVLTEATRMGRTVEKTNWFYFNYLASAPARMVSVTFDANGGEPASQTVLYAAGIPYGYLPTLASRTGYSGHSWYTAMEGGSRVTTASICDASVARLYARWSPNRYYVSYDANGGNGSMDGGYFYYDAPANLRANAFAKAGHAFAGWATEPDGAAVFGDKAAILNLASVHTNITLYATWVPGTYAVTLDAQNGTGGSASVVATYGAAMPAIAVPTRTGYAFGGYWDKKNGGGTQYYKADGTSARSCNLAAATTLYAKWTACSYAVTLDPNGGTGGTASVAATYGSALPAVAVPRLEGFFFGGYWTEPGGEGVLYYTGSGTSARNWDLASETTLYALWVESVPLAVHRFYSKSYKGHFFTIDEAEKQNLIDTNPNWRYEGVAYRAFEEEASGTVALHRFYSKGYRGHFFTIDADEAETVKKNPNWRYEGVAYYVYPEESEGTVPVFRFWSKRYRHHFYTTDESEKDSLVATNPNWKYEGVAFYALPSTDASVEAPAAAPAGKGVRRAVRALAAAWTLAADGAAIAVPGVTEAGGAVVETRLDAPDADELGTWNLRTFEPSNPTSASLRLALPAGAFRATLWSAAEGTVADETAEGAFAFGLPADGVWRWLRVRDGEGEEPFSVWLRAE